MSCAGFVKPSRRSGVVLSHDDRMKLRVTAAREGVIVAARRIGIASETLHTAASGGLLRADTAERIRKGIA